MKVEKKIVELQNELNAARNAGKSIGFVPTMGALHEGHASLIKRSVQDNDITVVSVFLNPTQFNDKADLERYPKTLDEDVRLAEACVVSRLFTIVAPDNAYFGEKDWQQIAVIKQLVDYMNSNITIVECPIIREADGLAMSSRNKLLTKEERAIAPAIYQALKDSLDYSKTHSVEETHDKVVAEINAIDGLEVEYFEIVDGKTLLAVDDWTSEHGVVGCITVYCGMTPIRLIDHIRYRKGK